MVESSSCHSQTPPVGHSFLHSFLKDATDDALSHLQE